MQFKQYFVAFLKQGPNWTAQSTPALEALQQQHLAHLAALGAADQLLLAGPVQPHGDADLRGISIFAADRFDSLDACIAAVEADPMFEIGHLSAEYATWYTPDTSIIHHGMQAGETS